jgi:hypothetical protein
VEVSNEGVYWEGVGEGKLVAGKITVNTAVVREGVIK